MSLTCSTDKSHCSSQRHTARPYVLAATTCPFQNTWLIPHRPIYRPETSAVDVRPFATAFRLQRAAVRPSCGVSPDRADEPARALQVLERCRAPWHGRLNSSGFSQALHCPVVAALREQVWSRCERLCQPAKGLRKGNVVSTILAFRLWARLLAMPVRETMKCKAQEQRASATTFQFRCAYRCDKVSRTPGRCVIPSMWGAATCFAAAPFLSSAQAICLNPTALVRGCSSRSVPESGHRFQTLLSGWGFYLALLARRIDPSVCPSRILLDLRFDSSSVAGKAGIALHHGSGLGFSQLFSCHAYV